MMKARIVLEGTPEEVEAALSGRGPVTAAVEAVEVGEPGSLLRTERKPLMVTMLSRMALPPFSDVGAGPFVRIYLDTRQETTTK